MKRALAILGVLACFGLVGFAQLGLSGFSGEWSGAIRITGTDVSGLRPGYLLLNFPLGDWKITSKSVFGWSNQELFKNLAFTEQQFTFSGMVGPFKIEAGMNFNAGITVFYCEKCEDGELTVQTFSVSAPEYMSSYLNTSLDIAGLSIGLNVKHWAFPYGCFTDCEDADYGMSYAITTKLLPLDVELTFLDCCEGIEFSYAKLGLKGVGLCCGITFDFELGFAKEKGFDYALFSVKDFFSWCCGISFDLDVKFTVDSKEVTLTPKFAGFGAACVTIYADLAEDSPNPLGIVIYGWKLSCTFADCYKLTVLTVLEAPPEDPKTCYPPTWYYGVFSATLGEFEYIQFDACGAGCCGGKWTAYARFYFGENGKLFGLTRIRGYVSVPVMANLSITGTWTATVTTVPASLTFDIGWKLTF